MSDRVFMRSNFAWMLVGNLTFAACRWGWFVILAKFGTPYAAGELAFAVACTSPLFMLTNLQLRQLQSVGACQHADFADYVAARLAGIVCALAALTVVAEVSGRWTAGSLLMLFGLAKGADACSDVVYGRLQHQETMKPVALSLMLRGSLGLALFAFPILMGGSVLQATAGLAVGWSLVFVFFDRFSLSGAAVASTPAERASGAPPLFHPRWVGPNLRDIFCCGWPLGVVMMLIALIAHLPVYFLRIYCGTAETGIFAALFCFWVGEQIVVVSLGQTASPRLARYFSQRDHVGFLSALGKVLVIANAICGVCLIGAWIGGEAVLAWLYSPEYARHASLLMWMMGAAWVGNVSSVVASALTAAQSFHAQMFVFAVVAFTSLLACWGFIPQWGLPGAILAMFVASVVLALGSCAALGRHLRLVAAEAPPPDFCTPPRINRAA